MTKTKTETKIKQSPWKQIPSNSVLDKQLEDGWMEIDAVTEKDRLRAGLSESRQGQFQCYSD